MSDRAPQPADRYTELADAAFELMQHAAVADIVCRNIQAQVAPYRVPAQDEGFTDLLLTSLQTRAFACALNSMSSANEKLNDMLNRHGG